MSTLKRIYYNMAFLSAAELVSKALQFAVMVYAARLLDPTSFGKFNFALSISFIAVILADMGINNFLIREVARSKNLAGKYFSNSLIIKLVFSVTTLMLIIACLNAMGYPKETRQIVYVIWIFSILSTFTDFFYSVFRAFERMHFDAILKITRMILLSISSIYVLFVYRNVLIFSMTFAATEIIIFIIAYLIATKKFVRLKLDMDFKFMKRIITQGFPFGLSLVFGSVYFYIASIMLSKLRSDVEVAIFSASYNLILAILFIPTIYINALYPVMSRFFNESRKDLLFIYQRSLKYMYIIGLPITIGTFFFAGRIIRFFYGDVYTDSIIILKILSFTIFLKFMSFLTGYTLSSINQQKNRMMIQGITAAFNLVLNFFLISRYGYLGAAISSLITEVFIFILYYSLVSRKLDSFDLPGIILRPLVASTTIFIIAEYARIGLVLSVLFSAIAYFGAVIVLKSFDDKDREIFSRIMR